MPDEGLSPSMWTSVSSRAVHGTGSGRTPSNRLASRFVSGWVSAPSSICVLENTEAIAERRAR